MDHDAIINAQKIFNGWVMAEKNFSICEGQKALLWKPTKHKYLVFKLKTCNDASLNLTLNMISQELYKQLKYCYKLNNITNNKIH